MPTDAPPPDAPPPDAPPTDAGLSAELQAVWDQTLPGQPELGARVIARYAEPHRHYHTVEHLAAVLDRVAEFAAGQDLFLVRLAAFYHDAIYDIPTRELTNEEASARLALRELGRAGLEQEDLGEVARLIRLTATHRPGPRDPEGELLCDADLAVLGGTPQAYARYVTLIGREYAHLPRREFALGRYRILVGLCSRDLFHSARGRALNRPARANLTAECRELAAELLASGVSAERLAPIPDNGA